MKHDGAFAHISRRHLLASAASLAGTAYAPNWALAADGAWSMSPSTSVDSVRFCAFQVGEIYTAIAERFQTDWGVKFDPIFAPYNDYQNTMISLFAAGETIDAGPAYINAFGVWVDQGLVEPLDGLPGLDEYVADFTPIQKRVSTYDGQIVAMPFHVTCWVWNYNEALLNSAGFDAPFSTYDGLIDQCLKAKRDGVAEYPILWVAGAGPEHLLGTWATLTWNMHQAKFFDDDGNHLLGEGSGAREALKWLTDTFTKHDIADPESLRVQMGGSANAFKTGKNIYRGPNHHYGLRQLADPAQSPIADVVRVHGFPGDGRSLANAYVYIMTTANGDKEWAWKLLQYLGGRTKDGELTQARFLLEDQMFGSGYKEIMDGPEIREIWSSLGRRAEAPRHLEQRDVHRRRYAVLRGALAARLDRHDQHRSSEMPARQHHPRRGMRQHHCRNRQGEEVALVE